MLTVNLKSLMILLRCLNWSINLKPSLPERLGQIGARYPADGACLSVVSLARCRFVGPPCTSFTGFLPRPLCLGLVKVQLTVRVNSNLVTEVCCQHSNACYNWRNSQS